VAVVAVALVDMPAEVITPVMVVVAMVIITDRLHPEQMDIPQLVAVVAVALVRLMVPISTVA
jgi:hypothetical protein